MFMIAKYATYRYLRCVVNVEIPNNYCPISLTCVLCRVLEQIPVQVPANILLAHLFANNLLLPFQFGLLPGRSACAQIISVLSNWFIISAVIVKSLLTLFTVICPRLLIAYAIVNY